MPDNLIADMRQLLQDMIAPDLKALTYKVDGLQKQVELTEKSMMVQLEAFRAEMGAFRAEMRREFQANAIFFRMKFSAKPPQFASVSRPSKHDASDYRTTNRINVNHAASATRFRKPSRRLP